VIGVIYIILQQKTNPPTNFSSVRFASKKAVRSSAASKTEFLRSLYQNKTTTQTFQNKLKYTTRQPAKAINAFQQANLLGKRERVVIW